MISAFCVSACTGLVSRVAGKPETPKVSTEARKLLDALEGRNPDLETFRGAGNIRFQKNAKKEGAGRVAWVGSVPDRLRIALRSVSGQPLVSVASDGTWVYFFSHLQQRYLKQRASAAFLQNFFSISITPEDVVRVLAGQVPIPEYSFAAVEIDPHETGCILVLKSSWRNVVGKIYFRENRREVYKVEVFDRNGDFNYVAHFSGEQVSGGNRIPGRLVFSDGQGSGFELEVEKFWAGIRANPSVFVLPPPDDHGPRTGGP